MLVMEVIDDSTIRVIHYNRNPEADIANGAHFLLNTSGMGSGPLAKVQQEVKTFTASELSTLEVLRYPSSFNVCDDPIERALRREDETDYRVLGNNCESFANWCSTGRNVTPQGTRAQITLVGATVGGLFGGMVGRAYSEHLKKDEDTKLKIEAGAAIGGALIGALLGHVTGQKYTGLRFVD